MTGNKKPSNKSKKKVQRPPVAFNRTSGGRAPVVRAIPNGVRVKGRVLIAKIDTESAFLLKDPLYINPLAEYFGPLAVIASAYETWEPKLLTFDYEGACGTDVDSKVFLLWDPDPSDSASNAHLDGVAMMRAGFPAYTTAWGECHLSSKVSALARPRLYLDVAAEFDEVHTSNKISRKVIRQSMAGALLIGTEGAAHVGAGFVWCNYDFVFRTLAEKVRESKGFTADTIGGTGTALNPWPTDGTETITESGTVARVHHSSNVPSHVDFQMGAGLWRLQTNVTGAGITGLTMNTPLVNATGTFATNHTVISATQASAQYTIDIPYGIYGIITMVISGATSITAVKMCMHRTGPSTIAI